MFPALLLLTCWLLRSKYALLGDNWLRVDQAVRGDLLPWKWGVMLLSHLAIASAHRLGDVSPNTALALFNSLASLPFAVATISLARSLGRDEARRGLAHLALLGLGGVQLFCGYLEVYSWTFALLAVYLAVLMRPMGWRRLGMGAVVLGLATALHTVAILFLPSLLTCFWILLRTRRRPSPPGNGMRERHDDGEAHTLSGRHVGLGIVAVLGTAAVLPLISGGLPHAHFSGPADPLPLLSTTLLWERVNGLVLASPLGALLGVPALLWAAVQTLRGGGLTDRAVVLLAAALPVLLVLSMMKMVLGAADWDILCFAGLPLCLWALVANQEMSTMEVPTPPATAESVPLAHRQAGRSVRRERTPIHLLVFLSLCNSWGFVLVNHSGQSIGRFSDILADDPAPYFRDRPAALHVGLTLRANHLPSEAVTALRRGLRSHPDDPRLPYNLAGILFETGDLDEARAMAETAVRTVPDYFPALRLIYLIDGRRGDRHGQYEVGRAILEIERRRPEFVRQLLTTAQIAGIRSRVAQLETHLQDGE